MKKTLLAIAAVAALAFTGCSHNPAVFAFGKLARIGNVEYGEVSYINGVYILDVSRENSSWEMEVDDEAGIQYDSSTGNIKGIKKIKRTIGPQVSGYLVDLAEESPEVAQAWVNNVHPAPLKKRKGQGNQNLNKMVDGPKQDAVKDEQKPEAK